MYSFILIPDFHLSWARRRAQSLTTYPWQNWTSILSRTPGRAISSVTEGVKIPRGILSFHKLGLGIKCTTMLSFSSVYEMHCCLNGCVRKVTRTPSLRAQFQTLTVSEGCCRSPVRQCWRAARDRDAVARPPFTGFSIPLRVVALEP